MELNFSQNTMMIIIFALSVLLSFILGVLIQFLKDSKKIKQERKDAVKRSRAVLTGQFSEQLSPYLPGFPCNPSQVKFLGKPVDFVAFVENPDTALVEEILFIEVKTGNSKLTEREQSIKTAISHHKVKFIEYTIEPVVAPYGP